MNDVELLAELVGDIARDLRPEIEPLTAVQLAWQPGPQANSIGVTLWHMARGLDLLAVRILAGKPAEEEFLQRVSGTYRGDHGDQSNDGPGTAIRLRSKL